MLNVSVTSFYQLMKHSPEIRATLVEIPGIRGRYVRVDLLRRAIYRMSGDGGGVE